MQYNPEIQEIIIHHDQMYFIPRMKIYSQCITAAIPVE